MCGPCTVWCLTSDGEGSLIIPGAESKRQNLKLGVCIQSSQVFPTSVTSGSYSWGFYVVWMSHYPVGDIAHLQTVSWLGTEADKVTLLALKPEQLKSQTRHTDSAVTTVSKSEPDSKICIYLVCAKDRLSSSQHFRAQCIVNICRSKRRKFCFVHQITKALVLKE